MEVPINYLESSSKQFAYYKLLGEQTFAQLTDQQLFWQPNDASNSIAAIVKHLSGNMLSRWTDFLHSDGEKAWRDRDAEFLNDGYTREEMMQQWDTGWNCLLETLASLDPQDLEKIVYIRNMGHTVMEAINRQLAHYPYHIGQIVFMGKLLRNAEWESLSIRKGASQGYNQEKFAEDRVQRHFTDEFLGTSERSSPE